MDDLGYDSFSQELVLEPIVNVQIGIRELVRLRRYWKEFGIDNWLIAVNSYYWGEKNVWELLESKKRARLPSLEYGKGILDLRKEWEEKGL